MIKVIKKRQETNLSLLKKFNRKVKQSSRLLRFKKTRFKARNKSELKKKQEALKRAEHQKKRQKLYKLGKISQC